MVHVFSAWLKGCDISRLSVVMGVGQNDVCSVMGVLVNYRSTYPHTLRVDSKRGSPGRPRVVR